MKIEMLRQLLHQFHSQINEIQSLVLPSEEPYLRSIFINNSAFIENIFADDDMIDAVSLSADVHYFFESLMSKYSRYIPIDLCNSISRAIDSMTIEDDVMSIHPDRLKEVLHDFADAMAKMFNVTEKVLNEAKAKIEAVFHQEEAQPEEAPATTAAVNDISTEDAPVITPSIAGPITNTDAEPAPVSNSSTEDASVSVDASSAAYAQPSAESTSQSESNS